MPIPAHLRGTPIERELASLGASVVRVEEPMLILRAAKWRNGLARLGVSLPLWLVHDVGMLAVIDPASVPIGPRPGLERIPAAATELPWLEQWTGLVRELADSELMEQARAWKLSDDLIVVLLTRVLGAIHERYAQPRPQGPALTLPLNPETYRAIEADLPRLFERAVPAQTIGLLRHVVQNSLHLVIGVAQIDLDTLRLVGMMEGEQGTMGSIEALDLLDVFKSPEANDVVNFSLDLLPSVLETKRASGAQTYSVGGYSGIDRRGSIDSLMLTELAFDADLFDQRFAEKEVFYYAHERQHEQENHLHYICIDATASMRGQRSVFARGLALTLIKKLLLRGEEVYVRFFDSKLYETMHARAGVTGMGGIRVSQILRFQGERGRNYAKVFGLLINDLQRLARRDRRTPIVYVITHAECHVPVPTIERLRTMARLYGIFMLPSRGKLELDYVQHMHTVQVVDEAALRLSDERARLALDIVEDAARGATPGGSKASERGAETDGPRSSWV